LTVAACRAAGRSQTGSAGAKGDTLSDFMHTKRRESYESGYRTIRGRRSLALAVPRLPPLEGLAGKVKPSIRFIETGNRVKRRVASRLRDSGSSNPCRHSWQKIRRDARGDRSPNRALIAVVCTSQTCRQRRHRVGDARR
jgi:hypothetical protein